MTIIQAFFLGIIQGITEFLPVSSSGHLVLLPYLLGWEIPAEQIFPFDVLVQIGTLLTVIFYFRKDILTLLNALLEDLKVKKVGSSDESRLAWLLMLATIPAALAGLLLKDLIESIFSQPTTVAFFLFGTSVLLVLAEMLGKKEKGLQDLKWYDALWIGVFQILALFPGVSRSGATMAGGMTRNLDRKSSGRFSFLMAIPIMAGAGLLSLFDLFKVPNLGQFLPVMLVGFITAAVVGYFAISWLMNFVQNHSLFIFAIYCFVLGAALLGFSFIFPQNEIAAPETVESSLPEQVVYTTELDWLAPIAAQCMQTTLEDSLPVIESAEEYQSQELRLSFPVNTNKSSFSFQLGTQALLLSVHPDNPLSALNTQDLIALLAGEYENWGEFFGACSSCAFNGDSSQFNGEINVILYPASHPYMTSVSTALNISLGQLSNALLAPTSEAVFTSLQLDRFAVTFLPDRWTSQGTRTVSISGVDSSALTLPILASLDEEPLGQLKDFLLCVQTSL